MEHALLSIALLLIVAKIAEGLAVRLRQSALAAYVLAGIILGPALGVVEPSEELKLFFGVGVIFLFFLLGVDEIDISGFVATLRGRFFLAAMIAFLTPLAASFAVTRYVMDFPTTNALALSGVLSLSSLGVTAKVLSDLGHLKEPLGLEIFTTVVIVELLGPLLVGFMLQDLEGDGELGPLKVVVLLAQIAGFAVVAWILASRLFPPVLIRLRRWLGASQLAFAMLVGVLFLTVWGAEQIGLHGSLGALLFGIALSELPHRLSSEVMPGIRSLANGLFIPLFFASVGLHLDLSFTELPGFTILAIVLAAALGKFAGSLLGPLVSRLTNPFAIASGLMAKGVAEIALLLVMLDIGAITPDVFSLITIIMIVFIFVMPPVIGSVINRAKAAREPTLPGSIPPSYARYAMDNVVVKDFLDTNRRFAQAGLSVRDFMEQWVVPEQQDYVIVRGERQLAGIFSLQHLRSVPNEKRSALTVGELVRHHHPHAYPDDSLDDVLEYMAEHWLSVVPVVEPQTGELLGAVTSRDVMALMTGHDTHP